jgi:hypothetical protein
VTVLAKIRVGPKVHALPPLAPALASRSLTTRLQALQVIDTLPPIPPLVFLGENIPLEAHLIVLWHQSLLGSSVKGLACPPERAISINSFSNSYCSSVRSVSHGGRVIIALQQILVRHDILRTGFKRWMKDNESRKLVSVWDLS